MGNQNSSAAGAERQAPAKTCYYELLEIEQDSTEEEIKKAYRRKALELHPDKNINDVENATRRFAEVQAAYEILSDPQERAWYDSHREAILHGLDGEDGAPAPEFRNVRITSTDEILALLGRFNSTVPFTDEPTGFFGRLREMFDHLAAEEMAAGDYGETETEPVAYPSFGTASDAYETVVKAFYAQWSSFSTRKTFSWKNKYRLSDAPDRRVRRLMEKENKKCRDDAIREFNDAVRFLVVFARKRDPRYLPNTQTDADRQKALRDAVAAQAARSRAANKEKLVDSAVPDWAQSRDDAGANDEFSASSEEESELEQIECVVCNKTFKSEKQYEAHEKSKKHVKAVQQLRRQMRKENIALSVEPDPQRDAQRDPPSEEEPVVVEESHDPAQSEANGARPQRVSRHSDSKSQASETTSDDDEDYAPRDVVEERFAGKGKSLPGETASAGTQEAADGELLDAVESVALGDKSSPAKKLGKAKAKREKKAARESETRAQASQQAKCTVCGEVFASKTKLFTHIREEGHAALRSELPPSRGGRRKK